MQHPSTVTYRTTIYRRGLLLILFIFISNWILGQSVISGYVRDTTLHKDCFLAVVTLSGSDSTLLQFTRTGNNGHFRFEEVRPGIYQLRITHPSYGEYVSSVEVKKNGAIDLGILSLPPRSEMLAAALVTSKAPLVHRHGDTLEYNTSHVKTRVNAVVEELLQRLPGMKIDQNGVITVNGKRVERLLVDGEDFFSGKPTVATKNLNADMIDKVQILEKKSKEAEFTGVDDGKRTTTLNLVLKEDSKKGYILKTEAGESPQGYYSHNALLGSFNGSRQLAVMGIMANTGNSGFDGSVDGFGAGLDIESGITDPLGTLVGGGIPRVTGIGAHFANKWNASQGHLAGDYSYAQVNNHPFSTLLNQQILTDSIYIQKQASSSYNSQRQAAFSTDYDLVPDTLNALRFSIRGKDARGHNEFVASGSNLINNILRNSNTRIIESDVKNQNLKGTLAWRTSARNKKGGAIAVIINVAQDAGNTHGLLHSYDSFYTASGAILSMDTVEQHKEFYTGSTLMSTSLSYAKPIWKDVVLATSYEFSFNNVHSSQSTFNRGNGKYDDYVDSLSSDYRNTVFSQKLTVNLQGQGKKITYTVGGDVISYNNGQRDLLHSDPRQYDYLDFAPRINFGYNMNQTTAINFNYGGGTLQPSITQLQPTQINNDPLHTTIGNPDLHPGFSHNFSIGFSSLKSRQINLTASAGFITDNISVKTSTDSLGRQVSQAVNVNGTRNAGLFFIYNDKIKKIDMDVVLVSFFSYNHSLDYINELLTSNDNVGTGGGFKLSKFVPDRYSVVLNTNFNYNFSKSSATTGLTTQYWVQSHTLAFSVFFHSFELNSNALYNWRQRLDEADRKNSALTWNVFVGKNLLSNRLEIKWRINDILGQNVGISRYSTANQTIENNYKTIGRYWMVSASWRFMHHRKGG